MIRNDKIKLAIRTKLHIGWLGLSGGYFLERLVNYFSNVLNICLLTWRNFD